MTDDEKIEVLERRLRRLEAAVGDLARPLWESGRLRLYPTLKMWFDALVAEIDRVMDKEGK